MFFILSKTVVFLLLPSNFLILLGLAGLVLLATRFARAGRRLLVVSLALLALAGFAPIGVGQRIGTVKLTLDGKPYAEFPVVALEAVTLAGVLGRGWDSIRLLFK